MDHPFSWSLTWTLLLLASGILLPSFAYCQEISEHSYHVTLYDEQTEAEYDTTFSFDYLANDPDFYLFTRFNYPPFQVKFTNEEKLILFQGKHEVEILAANFDSAAHKLRFSTENGYMPYLESIDGKNPWGVDGGIPRIEISGIILRHGADSTLVSPHIFADLYEPGTICHEIEGQKSCYINAYLTERDELILSMLNGDGAGGYIAILIFDGQFNLRLKSVGHGF
ncbi:MAG: hypothetical protein AAGI38_02045 [Bacteroidota bacterium]